MKVLRSIQPNERRLWCAKAVLLRKPSEKERQRLSKNSGNKLPKPSKMARICLSETTWLQMKKQFQEERLPSDAAKRTSSKYCSLVINLCKSLMMPRKCKCFIKLFFVKLDLFTNLLLSLARRKLNKGERLQKMSIWMCKYSSPSNDLTCLKLSSMEARIGLVSTNQCLSLTSFVSSANEFATAFRPVIIVPAMLVPGNLSLANIKQFLEDGVYCENPDSNL